MEGLTLWHQNLRRRRTRNLRFLNLVGGQMIEVLYLHMGDHKDLVSCVCCTLISMSLGPKGPLPSAPSYLKHEIMDDGTKYTMSTTYVKQEQEFVKSEEHISLDGSPLRMSVLVPLLSIV
jgi:hypothetical protein